MGCNCGKGTPPAGMGQRAPRDPATPPPPVKPPTHSIRKGLTGQTQTFTLTTGDGRTQTFGSKLEAQAERARNHNGQGSITPG